MSAIEYWLWLSTSAKLSPRAKAVLLKHYGSPEAMYEAPKGEITKLLGRRGDGAEDLEKRDLSSALRTIDRCGMQNIEVVSIDDPRYPVRLKNIYAPPHIIYVKGRLPKIDEEPAIAVIGTRNASPYGIKMGRKLGFEIAKCGGVVISGLTKGIDAAGAEGARGTMQGGKDMKTHLSQTANASAFSALRTSSPAEKWQRSLPSEERL